MKLGAPVKKTKKEKRIARLLKSQAIELNMKKTQVCRTLRKKRVSAVLTALVELPLTQLTIQLENNHIQFHWGTQHPLTPTCFQSRNRNRFESDEGRLPSGPSMEENLADAGRSGMRHTRCPPTVSQSTCCRCHGERKQGGQTVPGCDEHAGTRPSGSIFGRPISTLHIRS